MEVNMAKKDLDLEDLLGLTDKTIQVELDIKQKEPAKGTLEYDLWKLFQDGTNTDDYLKQMKQEQMAEDEFMRLFVKCFPRIIKVFQNDPAQHIAVNCAGCRYSNRVELGYGKATTKRSATNGYRK